MTFEQITVLLFLTRSILIAFSIISYQMATISQFQSNDYYLNEINHCHSLLFLDLFLGLYN
jgi:hypothetical protein